MTTTFEKIKVYCEFMDWAKIKDGLKTVMEISGDCNKFIQDNEIWSANADQVRKNNVLCILANCIRLLACLYPHSNQASSPLCPASRLRSTSSWE